MPLAEGGPCRTSSPLGAEPRIALPWGSPDPITRHTNTQPHNGPATCQRADINSDVIADKQKPLLCFVVDKGTALTNAEKWLVSGPRGAD